MTTTDIVNKLIGDITPIGQSSVDAERLENLKNMCELVNNLVTQIDNVGFYNRDSREHSVKIMSEYADNFMTKTLGIV